LNQGGKRKMNTINNTRYDFEQLRQQIINQDKWRNDVFVVYPFEAGSGKSRESQRFLGEMTKQYGFRALYVQRFVKDNQLQETVNRINEYAEKEVAVGITGEDNKSKKALKKAIEAQILVCSHSMYKQFCRGLHPELTNNRQILIIDERMDLVERFTVSIEDIGNLWGSFSLYKQGEIVEVLAELLKKKYYHYLPLIGSVNKKEMYYVDFKEDDFVKYQSALDELISLVTDKNHKMLLMKVKNLIKSGGLFFENQFHSVEDIRYVMLENNIILDANGSFDATYRFFNEMFSIQKQPPIFDYSQTILHHFEVKTGKGSLEKYASFFQDSLEKIDFSCGSKILFVTDKDSVDKVQEALLMKFAQMGDNLEEIEEHHNIKLETEYFGNIIGRNDFRDFDKVVILKTPNYSYIDYSMLYFYFQVLGGNSVGNIQVFEHEQVEAIRKSVVAGETYQAIKRINRDLTKKADIYLFCGNQETVDMVLNQLQNVQYVKREMTIENKRKKSDSERKEQSSFDKKVTLVQEALVACAKKVSSIKKKEFREQLGILDKHLFAKILKNLAPFLQANQIESHGQQLIFK